MIVLWDADPTAPQRYELALGGGLKVLTSAPVVARALAEEPQIRQIVVGPDIPLDNATDLAESIRLTRPEVGVILVRHRIDVATLSDALRSGIREVVPADEGTALADAVRHSEELTARMMGQHGVATHEGKVVTVFSAKGGVGKTTISTNLSVYLASAGLRVLLVDLDLSFGDVAISLQLDPGKGIVQATGMAGHLDAQGLEGIVTTHPDSGLDVLCAPMDPAEADRIPVALVGEILRVARMHYDFVVVDTPPSFTEHVLAACDVSNALVLIATLDIPAVKNLRIALDTLDMLGVPRDSRVIVLNRSDAKVGLRAEDVESAIKTPIAVSMPTSVSVPASINRGVAIVLDEPKHPVSVAVREIGDVHIRQRFGAVVPARESNRKSLFRGRR